MIISISTFLFIVNSFTKSQAGKTEASSVTHKSVVVSPNNDSLNISKYKGKVVILNFWASWSKASRAENKNLVRIFQKYRTNPKVVFVSVSLDTDEASWKTAIEEDNLEWKEHYCDFMKYDSPMAKSYQISTLPIVYLLDKSGNVIKTASKIQEIESYIDGLIK